MEGAEGPSTELADGQGGCDVTGMSGKCSTGKRKANDVSRIEKFIGKGEYILSNFQESITGFEAQANSIKEMASVVNTLREDMKELKRKAATTSCPVPNKRQNISLSHGSGSSADEISDRSEDSDEDSVDELLNENKDTAEKEDASLDFIEDLDSFFMEETATGENVGEKIKAVVNKSLRNKTDVEKMKKLRDKHKRPGNIDNLQVPKVDSFLWEQLKSTTKNADFLRQITISEANQALIPVIKAMEIITSNKPDLGKIREYLGDTFKFLTNTVSDTNHHRREAIKKELAPKFKSLCNAEHPTSSTKLFGDNLSDDCKQMEANKKIKVTEKAQQQQHFLSHRGGQKGFNFPGHNHPYQHRPPSNFNRKPQHFQRNGRNLHTASKNMKGRQQNRKY